MSIADTQERRTMVFTEAIDQAHKTTVYTLRVFQGDTLIDLIESTDYAKVSAQKRDYTSKGWTTL